MEVYFKLEGGNKMEESMIKNPDNFNLFDSYIENLLQLKPELSFFFGELKNFDLPTWQHSYRAGVWCKQTAEFKEFKESLKELFVLAGLFHDIGKICLPLEIIQKNGKLTSKEKQVVDLHAETGYYFLIRISPNLAYLVLCHHSANNIPPFLKNSLLENNDSCFPSISVNEIENLLPFLRIVDHFDALVFPRCYKKNWKKEKILEYLLKNFQSQEEIIKFLLQKYFG